MLARCVLGLAIAIRAPELQSRLRRTLPCVGWLECLPALGGGGVVSLDLFFQLLGSPRLVLKSVLSLKAASKYFYVPVLDFE